MAERARKNPELKDKVAGRAPQHGKTADQVAGEMKALMQDELPISPYVAITINLTRSHVSPVSRCEHSRPYQIVSPSNGVHLEWEL
jgi:hypothetical protein